mgnify:CR=1 FL=1
MIKLVNVSKYYSANGVVALGLRKANLELHVGEFVAITGESGSGKTTLLNVISGIDSYEEGEMYLNGEETSYFSTADMENYRKKYIAFVFQSYNLVDSFTVRQNVELPMLLAGASAKEAKSRALEIIRKVGLEKHVNHKATKLSGGQKQRVVIARALAKDCPIIAADEPTGNLDSESAKQVLNLLHEIAKDKLVLVVTHDFSQVQEYATRKVRIYDGEIVEDKQIRQTEHQDLPVIPDEAKRIRIGEHMKMAFKTLFAAPKKALLMVIVFFIFAFLVSLVYGAYNLEVTGQSGYSDYYSRVFFRNKSVSRIIVRKTDKSPLSAFDIAELAALGQVQAVVERDYLLDARMTIRSDELFETLNNNYLYVSQAQFLPLSVITESKLWAGVMPSAANEVVLVLPEAQSRNLDYQQYYLDENYTYFGSSDVSTPFSASYKIVGLVKAADIHMDDGHYVALGETEYRRTAEAYYHAYLSEIYMIPEDGDVTYREWLKDYINYGSLGFTVNVALADDELRLNQLQYQSFYCEYGASECDVTVRLHLEDAYTTTTFTDLKLSFASAVATNAFEVSQNLYDQIFYEEIYQVTVFANTEINVNRLISSISSIRDGATDKYKVVYPKTIKTVDQLASAISFFQTLGLLLALVVTIGGATLLSYVVFRLIINTKLRDYAIFRTVGANQGMIRMLVYFENIITVSFSYVLFVALSLVIRNLDSITRYSILYGLKVFAFGNYLIFFGIVLMIALLISGRYCRRVFQDTVHTALKLE